MNYIYKDFNGNSIIFSESDVKRELISIGNIKNKKVFLGNKELSSQFKDYIWNVVKNRIAFINSTELFDVNFDEKINFLAQLAPQIKNNPTLKKCYQETLKKFYDISPEHFSVQQDLLTNKIKDYLTQANNNLSQGACYGLSCLFGYYHFLGKGDEFYNWLIKCQMADVGDAKEFTKKSFISLNKEEWDFEQFLDNLLFLHQQQNHYPIDLSMAETLNFASNHIQNLNLDSVVQFASSFHASEHEKLVEVLYKLLNAVSNESKFLLITTKNHTMGFFCEKQDCVFFDSNFSFRFPHFNIKDKNHLQLIVKYLFTYYGEKNGALALSFETLAKSRLNLHS